jgi:regulatory protein
VSHDVDANEDEKPKAKKASGFQLSLKGRALRLLSMREHSRQELERKLKAFEETPGELAQALDFLAAKDFINEQRVVEGLPAEAISEAVQAMRSTELERAREVWRKKFGAPPEDQAARAKQIRFLVSRGFAPEVVKRVVAGAEDV